MTEPALAAALALALTGKRLALPGRGPVGDELAAEGFDAAALAALRAKAQQDQEPWPFPVPLEERRGIGFARFDAALKEARRALGLDGLHREAQSTRPLNRDELRLVADRPPHWG